MIPFKYQDISLRGDAGYITAERNDKWGVVSYKTGEETSEFIYEATTSDCYQWGMFAVSKEGKSGVIDPWGKIILPFEYDVRDDLPYIKSLTPNLLCARKDGKWLLINRQNKTVVPAQEYLLSPVRKLLHGLIDVVEEDENENVIRRVGYMDIKGNKYWED